MRSILKIVLLFSTLLMFGTQNSYGQKKSKAEIKNVDFEIRNSKLIAIYDIVNFEPEEKYFVSIQIIKNDEELLIANTLSGDVNKFIGGGLNKKIEWDMLKDKIILTDSIQIKLIAKTEENMKKKTIINK